MQMVNFTPLAFMANISMLIQKQVSSLPKIPPTARLWIWTKIPEGHMLRNLEMFRGIAEHYSDWVRL